MRDRSNCVGQDLLLGALTSTCQNGRSGSVGTCLPTVPTAPQTAARLLRGTQITDQPAPPAPLAASNSASRTTAPKSLKSNLRHVSFFSTAHAPPGARPPVP